MPSSPTTEKRCSAERSALAGALVLLLACACARAERNRAHGSAAPRDTSTALPVPSAQAPGAEPVSPEEAAAAPAPAAAPGPVTRQTLETVTAERLLERVRELGGKGTLVSAWASWCGPCKRELPLFQKLAARFGPEGVSVLIVSMDEPDDREKAELFLVEHGVGLKSYLAARPLGPFKTGLNPRWPGMLPASFLFDATGTLRYFWGGEAFEQEVVPVLEAFVKGRAIDGQADFVVAPGP